MKFEKALKLLRKGKHIRRKSWNTNNKYFFIKDGKVLVYIWESFFGFSITKDITINSDDLMANDWEIIE